MRRKAHPYTSMPIPGEDDLFVIESGFLVGEQPIYSDTTSEYKEGDNESKADEPIHYNTCQFRDRSDAKIKKKKKKTVQQKLTEFEQFVASVYPTAVFLKGPCLFKRTEAHVRNFHNIGRPSIQIKAIESTLSIFLSLIKDRSGFGPLTSKIGSAWTTMVKK